MYYTLIIVKHVIHAPTVFKCRLCMDQHVKHVTPCETICQNLNQIMQITLHANQIMLHVAK